nr:MAG TPA: hypothetical protein [Caudoviricetes sp.]
MLCKKGIVLPELTILFFVFKKFHKNCRKICICHRKYIPLPKKSKKTQHYERV